MADNIESTIARRFAELVSEGEELLKAWDSHEQVKVQTRPSLLSWLLSTVNLLEVSMPSDSRHRREAQSLLPKSNGAIWPQELATMLGILTSAAAEWRNGLINTLELRYVSLAFEDFLEHATIYNDQGRQMEAAVLASAVLEDTIKRLCQKHNIATDDKTLDSLISSLKASRVLGKVKAERLRSFAALRNQAFHAQWAGFDKRDLGQMIEGLEEILETHFTGSG
jgi:uncharacterized protein YutE (UPF0331/DUF86 family)